MQLVVPIAANVVLGIVLAALFLSRRASDDARLNDGDEALRLFRRQFPDADGAVVVAADYRGALIALHQGTAIGLLERRGRRWTARRLAPGDLRSVDLAGSDTLSLTLADFGWPRARFQIADPEARAAWLARLQSFVAGAAGRQPPVSSHA
jgi:hypothetical protein